MGIPRIIYLIELLSRASESTPEKVAQIREKRFRRLLHIASTKSPFYQKLYRGIDLNTCRLTDLPVITKPQMMAEYDDFVTDRRIKRTELREWLSDKTNLGKYYKNAFIPFQTSGTTGENALVIYDREAMDWVHAAIMARHALPALLTFGDRLRIMAGFLRRSHQFASIVMTGGPYPAYTAALYTPNMHRLFVNTEIFSLLEPIDTLVAKLNEFQPKSIFSYPSVLNMLAREQQAGRLHITLDEEISALATGSEPLSMATRQLVEEVWGKGVQDTYGTSECFIMARACNQFDRMHVMSDMCILEIVDRHYRPVPDGEIGEKVLLTNLFNHVQPFVRYEISDVTGYSLEPCACGSPFPTLLPVQGRTDDIFYIDRAEGGYESVHPYLFLGPIVELDEVKEYQLSQTGRNEFTFRYVPIEGAGELGDKVRRTLLAGLQKAGLAQRITLNCLRVTEIPRDKRSGKFRQIISEVGAPADLDEATRREH
mgnify:FL=1